MKAYLESIATDNDWLFLHARADYLQMEDDDPNNPSNLIDGQVFIGLDPVQDRHDISPNYGVRQGLRWTGRFMILLSSQMDESYEEKYTNYIQPIDEHLKTIEKTLACQGLTLNSWTASDLINGLFENCDGKVVQFDVTKEADKGETPNRLTSLAVTNNSQMVASGVEITPIEVTTDQDAIVTLKGTHTGLTLTKNSSTSWTISGEVTEPLNFVVHAKGVFGGFEAESIDIDLSGMATPITSMALSNNNQTIWEESGNGELVELVFTPDPTEAEFSLDDANIPAGLEVATDRIRVTDFSLIPVGDNSFDIDWSGSGDYSGSGTVSVTITKRELWTPLDLDNAATRVLQFLDFSEDGNATIVDNRFSALDDRSENGNNAAQVTPSLRPYVSDINNVRAALLVTSSFVSNLGVDIGTGQFQFFTFHEQIAGGSSQFFYSRNNTDYLLRNVQTNFFNFRKGGSISSFSPDVEESRKVYGQPVLFHVDFEGGASGAGFSDFRADGGESAEQLNFASGSGSFLSSNDASLGSRDPNSSASPIGAKIGFVLFIDGSLTELERQHIEGFSANRYGTQEKLNVSHPFKTTPPFKTLP